MTKFWRSEEGVLEFTAVWDNGALCITTRDNSGIVGECVGSKIFTATLSDVPEDYLQIPGVLSVMHLIKDLAYFIPLKLYFGVGSRHKSALFNLWYSLQCDIMRYEYGHVIDSYSNIIRYFNNAFDYRTLNIETLQNSKCTLSVSDGKESTMMKHMFADLNIEATHFSLLDEFEACPGKSSPHSISSKRVLPTTPLSRVSGHVDALKSEDCHEYTIGSPIVPLRMAIALLYATINQQDYLFLGSPAEDQLLYRTKDGIYVPRASITGQWIFNILNAIELTPTKLYTPLMNMTMPCIVSMLDSKGIAFEACMFSTNCGKCSKCKTIKWIRYLLNDGEIYSSPYVEVARFDAPENSEPIFPMLNDVIDLAYGSNFIFDFGGGHIWDEESRRLIYDN